jgi:UDP-N-acetylglucosamine:LPS N-acetylglucosamine transferase
MERAGAAKMVLQRDLNGKKIADEIRAMVADPIQITKREAAAKLLGRADAAEQTADIIGNLAKHV